MVSRTTSGGVTINDVVMHVSMEDLPFGGIGPSGMGAYHGIDGFRAFSHAKAVFQQAKMDVTAMMRPPYGEKATRRCWTRRLSVRVVDDSVAKYTEEFAARVFALAPMSLLDIGCGPGDLIAQAQEAAFAQLA